MVNTKVCWSNSTATKIMEFFLLECKIISLYFTHTKGNGIFVIVLRYFSQQLVYN